MRKLIYSDAHIREESIEELNDTFEEIYSYIPRYCFDIIDGGDLFDKNRPTPKEIDFATYWMARFRDKAQLHILRGNHTAIDNKTSAVEYLTHLGIDICEEFIHDNVYVGHFMCEKSLKHFGEWDRDRHLVSLNKYRYVLLGHQHIFQVLIPDRAWHIGSIQFLNFGELNGSNKRIALIDANGIKFIELKSPIPMVEVFSIDDLKDIKPRTKVRLTFRTFEQFKKEINEVGKWKDNFSQFKIKLDFDVSTTQTSIAPTDFREIVNEWLNKVDDEEVKTILREEFKNI